jgi:hypothetical protein
MDQGARWYPIFFWVGFIVLTTPLDFWLCYDDEEVKPANDNDIKQLVGKGGGTALRWFLVSG